MATEQSQQSLMDVMTERRFRLLHQYKMRQVLTNAEFQLRNEAKRLGIIYYEVHYLSRFRPDRTTGYNANFELYLRFDYPQLTLLIKNRYGIYKEMETNNILPDERDNYKLNIYPDDVFNDDAPFSIRKFFSGNENYLMVMYDPRENIQEDEYFINAVEYMLKDEGRIGLFPAEFLRPHLKKEYRTKKVKSQIEKKKEYEYDSCPVCYDEWDKNKKILRCSHPICSSCFTELPKKECPICRLPFEERVRLSTQELFEKIMETEPERLANEFIEDWETFIEDVILCAMDKDYDSYDIMELIFDKADNTEIFKFSDYPKLLKYLKYDYEYNNPFYEEYYIFTTIVEDDEDEDD